ncbi:hypothetical protein MLD38_029511 [Melastoma candidum]|uniref:Uncharacterized protein n=1 Tax=Melastoma candidum TaxID=119954 RepID=A0ACB9N3Y7_9MYRT|nr:hypothetical protein MLD38_029511 [Melastoma candidum]
MVLARDLDITWGGDPERWRWIDYIESDDEEEIQVAVLLSVCWLEIKGKFPTIGLAPGTVYEVVFKVMMLDSSFGWSFPVKISATLPNGKKEEHEEFIERYRKNEWVDIPICEFTMSQENVGEVAFSMDEHDGGKWKHGMAVMGVSFCPKK